MTDACVVSSPRPYGLVCRVVQSKLEASARVDVRFARYLLPKDMCELSIKLDPERMQSLLTFDTIRAIAHAHHQSPECSHQSASYIVNALSTARLLPHWSPSMLVTALGEVVLHTCLVECITNRERARDLLRQVTMHGVEFTAGLFGMHECTVRNMHPVLKDLTVGDVVDNMTLLGATRMLMSLAPKMKPQAIEPAILDKLNDHVKVTLVLNSVWAPTTFQSVVDLSMSDPISVLCAWTGQAVPWNWLVHNAEVLGELLASQTGLFIAQSMQHCACCHIL